MTSAPLQPTDTDCPPPPPPPTDDRNLQKIRLCGPKLNISCETPPRTTLEAEAKWVPPTLADYERAAIAQG